MNKEDLKTLIKKYRQDYVRFRGKKEGVTIEFDGVILASVVYERHNSEMEWIFAVKLPNSDQLTYWRQWGAYSSYEGVDFCDEELQQVEPKQVLITVYNSL